VCSQGAIGKGTRFTAEDDPDFLRLNFTGHSYATRFMYTCAPRKLYENDETYFHALLEHYTMDAMILVEIGFTGPDGKRWHFSFIGVLGDWAWLVKAGRLIRSFYNVEKKVGVQSYMKGICQVCRAGQPGFPWEDFSLLAAFWDTVGEILAWDVEGELLPLMQYYLTPYEAYKSDVWHNLLLGAGKDTCAGGCILILDLVPLEAGIKKKFEYLDSNLKMFVKANKKNFQRGCPSAT
jgi:hypothetical protein